jgi:hypothetical protein
MSQRAGLPLWVVPLLEASFTPTGDWQSAQSPNARQVAIQVGQTIDLFKEGITHRRLFC